ncbi:MAG: spore germination protein [Bacilli bacterium]|jgi:spore germination protein KA
MIRISENALKTVNLIRQQTGGNPDIIIKQTSIYDKDLFVVFSESLSDRIIINDYILEYIEELKLKQDGVPDLFKYLSQNIPTHKVIKIDNYKDLYYNLLSGFTIVMVDGYKEVLSIETKAKLDSGVQDAKSEQIIKGPKDAFTENYQTNIGLIRKRIKSKDLWLEELIVGNKSKTKVGIMYVKDIASKKLVDEIVEKIKKIDIDGIFDSNYIIEMISENKKNVFANYLSTERPDNASIHLMDGRIAIVVENTQYVVIIPAMFVDFFHSTEDYYQKVTNVNLTRMIRTIAFFITLLTPAIYVAISTYNLEAIPAKLLISFSTQREGVPLPTIIEIMAMTITFELLRETDAKTPSAIGSSLSIVGALVLGQAAVAAGIVSPITIIVVSITAISGLIVYSVDMVNGIRWWRLIFLVFAALAGIYGILIASLIFIINVSSIKSFGIPFLTPFAPFYKREQHNAFFLTNKRKFSKRNHLTAKDNYERQAK